MAGTINRKPHPSILLSHPSALIADNSEDESGEIDLEEFRDALESMGEDPDASYEKTNAAFDEV